MKILLAVRLMDSVYITAIDNVMNVDNDESDEFILTDDGTNDIELPDELFNDNLPDESNSDNEFHFTQLPINEDNKSKISMDEETNVCGPIFHSLPPSLKSKFINVINEYRIRTQPIITEIIDRRNPVKHTVCYKIEQRHYNVSFEEFLEKYFLPENDFFNPWLRFLVFRFDREINYVETARLIFERENDYNLTITTEIAETNPFPDIPHYTLIIGQN